jgi:isopenicillin-N N-acyltransferase-like protein
MRKRWRKIFKRLIISLAVILLLIIAFLIYFNIAVRITPPVPDSTDVLKLNRTKLGKDFYVCKNNWLRKNKAGLWEMYVEGKPFEMGVMNGLLTKDLIYLQEKAFVNEIKKMIPSDKYLKFLKYFVAWFNRNIDKYVEKEYQLEILGVSQSVSDEFSDVGPAYQRILNYHAAHDIGHALQNLNMVGCTSFAAWGSASEDSSLIVGRNFDFYVGDDFSKNKIVCFCNPDRGYKFMYVTWGGMIGVVSGMNDKGVTVTLNAAPSKWPLGSKTPISILARNILQYAKNINEAYLIAKSHETFVSESILVGSAEDKKAVIIEKSPDNCTMVVSKSDHIICTNHFQSDTAGSDFYSANNIRNSSSLYRYKRVEELMKRNPKLNYKIAADILRNQKGLHDKNIGMGNEKAINQLIAHHSVIFNPAKLLVWVSSNPYQLGEYCAYDLKKIFKEDAGMKKDVEISEPELSIPADTFLLSDEYKKFKTYKSLRNEIQSYIKTRIPFAITADEINTFLSSNPQYYYVYSLLGDYFLKSKSYLKAIAFYRTALLKEVTSAKDVNKIMDALTKCYKNE